MAIQTKNTILQESDIDTVWAFEFYLNLPSGTLKGGDLKVKSPFSVDKDPSFAIYRHKNDSSGIYRYNDLSTGNKGDIIDLVAKLKSKTETPLKRKNAFDIIKKDFETFCKSGGTRSENSFLLNTKGKVTEWELRNWKQSDYAWWCQWNVSKETLEKYNVAPMGPWKMHKIKDGVEKVMDFNNPLAFGYLTSTGELARIYQPGMKGAKFIKVLEREWLQGLDQLQYNVPELIIHSSLKDGMSFMDMGFLGYEFIAPDSENVIISPKDINLFKTKYRRIRTFMDNDQAGEKSREKYKNLYEIEPIIFTMGKDLTDAVRDHSELMVKINLMQLL